MNINVLLVSYDFMDVYMWIYWSVQVPIYIYFNMDQIIEYEIGFLTHIAQIEILIPISMLKIVDILCDPNLDFPTSRMAIVIYLLNALED